MELGAECMVLSKSMVESKWTRNYTNPQNPTDNRLSVIKFFPSVYPGGINVGVQGYNNTDQTLGSFFSLKAGYACSTNLPPVSIGTSYDIDLTTLNFIDMSTGAVVPGFNKIVLYPDTEMIEGSNYLVFNASVYIGDADPATHRILPCPPCIFCKPRCDTSIQKITNPPPVTVDTAMQKIK
jgi:hypothetical protein